MAKTEQYYYMGQRLNHKKQLSHRFYDRKTGEIWLFKKNTANARIGELVEATETEKGRYNMEAKDDLIDQDTRTKWLMEDLDARRSRAHVIAREKAKKEDAHLGDMTVKELLEFANKSMSNGIMVRHWISDKTKGWKG